MIKIEYKVGDDILKIIQNTLYDHYRGKVDFTGPDPKQEVFIETGLGGMGQINRSIREMTINSGLVINAHEMEHLNESMFTTYIVPFLATMKFNINTELDPIGVDVAFINGFAKDSYTYRIRYESIENEPEVEIVAIGKLPEFRVEIGNLIRECKLDEKYEIGSAKLVKLIMNYLKTLE